LQTRLREGQCWRLWYDRPYLWHVWRKSWAQGSSDGPVWWRTWRPWWNPCMLSGDSGLTAD